ncbi:MAG: hypothetical protein IJ594_01815 [Oscillospiraceae bacterium]|nr:hypothetical protein [Oscillospiraceae bacterium]
MERFSEREAARQLRRFDAVWARVSGTRSAGTLAEKAGLPLMPRRGGCCRPPLPRRGR